MVIESGLSDFHKLTVSVLKTAFKKEPPNIISYRNYKNYSPVNFREELNQCFSENDIASISNDDFVTIVAKIFNKHAPIRYKHIRANDGPFMTKELRKAIMVRSKLRNKLNKEKTLEANLAYKKQRNICTSLLKQTKKAYYSNLNPSIITNSKLFWKTIKPVFTDKVQTNPSITLVENYDICHEDVKVAELFNTFFSKVVENLNLNDIDCIENGIMSDMNDTVITAVTKYQAHPSIIRIKESISIINITIFRIYRSTRSRNNIISSTPNIIIICRIC